VSALPRVERTASSAPVFPCRLTAVSVPPIKCQGIKTRLVPFIAANLSWDGRGRWIEPFLGSGVVGFNLAPRRAVLADSNRHIIAFYRAVQEGRITSNAVRSFLEEMDVKLRRQGEPFYYTVRERFNRTGEPLDLLFLNRASFNGLMRFNRQGGFNVPFGKKVERFRPAYVTKIANQVRRLEHSLRDKDWQFLVADWRQTLAQARAGDFVYLDPPYIGRHADYFNAWTEPEAIGLAGACRDLPCGYALSMWKENQFRQNTHLAEHWAGGVLRSWSHFYHVGPQQSLRHAMIEALVIRPGYAAPADETT
jgi:DNA adenine methylase